MRVSSPIPVKHEVFKLRTVSSQSPNSPSSPSSPSTWKKRLSHEFNKLIELDHFLETFMSFLKAKKNSESLEFVLEFENLLRAIHSGEEEEKDTIVRIQQLVNKFIKEGSVNELNLPHDERRRLLEKNEQLLQCSNPKQIPCTILDLTNSLDNLKDSLLVQLKEERFQEFKNSSYWTVFQSKLNEPKLNTTHDFSFIWLLPAKNWTPTQVSLWLKTMEIEEHKLFEEHEVDGEMLSSITREDLVSMGITKIGSLKKVLKLLQEISKK